MPTPNDAAQPVRIFRNDWSVLQPPEIGAWTPTRTVSVVIPAYNCQESLNLTLAALAHQTYPAELLEVVIADDTSEPPIELPKIRPANCRIVRVADHSAGWGRANALHVGADQQHRRDHPLARRRHGRLSRARRGPGPLAPRQR